MNFLEQALSFIFTAANWGGPAGLGARTLEHLQYTAIAVFFSVLIAVPVAAAIGVLARFAIGQYKHSQLYRGTPNQDGH